MSQKVHQENPQSKALIKTTALSWKFSHSYKPIFLSVQLFYFLVEQVIVDL
jgi:hypothetical protein